MIDRRLFLGSAIASGGLIAGRVNAQLANPPGAGTADSAMASGDVPDAIEILADYMLATPAGAIPSSALAITRAQLVDTVCVGLAGRNEDGVKELRAIGAETGGRGESAVWGTHLRLPAHDAARINAAMVHALEFDDTFGRGFLHPSAITFPAALAMADMVGGVSGAEFLTANTLAIDVACRLSIAGRPGVDGFATGWHNTALVGYLSSALVAGRLMKLSREELINAAGLAYHQAAGNAQAHVDSALAKRLGPGFASSAGVLSVRLAAKGVTGPRGVLEGEKGWFQQYHGGHYSRDLLLGGLGATFPAEETSFKPWPSCRGSHTSVDAALQLITGGARPGQIERIELRNGPAEYPFLSNPIDRKRRPDNVVEAQFSIPWVVAAAFADQKVSIAQFTPAALEREDIRAMADRVVPVRDERLANPAGGPGASQIDLTMKDGRQLSRHVAQAKGDPGVPMTHAEIDAKFADCIDHAGISAPTGAKIRELTLRIDELQDVRVLAEAMAVSS